MKVILSQDVDNLGRLGDVVSVKDGYARNFLLPRSKARPATPENIKAVEVLKKKRQEEIEKETRAAIEVSKRIEAASCTIAMPAGEEDRLHGSVTTEMIADVLKDEGIVIDKKEIILEEPIKKLGVYQVVVKIHPEVKANLKVWVIKE